MYQNSRYPRSPVRHQKSAKSKGWVGIAALIVLAILLVGGFFMVQQRNQGGSKTDPPSGQAPAFDKQQFSLTDPASPWLVVNKQRPLDPKDYAPPDLRTPDMNVESATLQLNDQTAAALEALDTAAKSDGISLVLASAYRSYDNQTTTYNSMVRGYGQTEADRQSARPGYSEHQTGWAADLGAANGKCRIETCFGDTPEGKWLAANAYKHGFTIRYPEGKEAVTGYNYEPWHLRFVGKELSEEMHRAGTPTLEEFFNLPAAPSY